MFTKNAFGRNGCPQTHKVQGQTVTVVANYGCKRPSDPQDPRANVPHFYVAMMTLNEICDERSFDRLFSATKGYVRLPAFTRELDCNSFDNDKVCKAAAAAEAPMPST